MKPAPFDYVAPRSLDEALALLDGDARVLAGGQSLVPLLNLRLARPARVVDINRIDGLGVLRRSEGTLRIGATVRQAALERSPLVPSAGRCWPRRCATSATPRPARAARSPARPRTPTRPRSCRWRCWRSARTSSCARPPAPARSSPTSSSAARTRLRSSPASC